MPTKKHVKNRLLVSVSRAIADLRIALEYAETGSLPDEAAEIDEAILTLVDLNNMMEQI